MRNGEQSQSGNIIVKQKKYYRKKRLNLWQKKSYCWWASGNTKNDIWKYENIDKEIQDECLNAKEKLVTGPNLQN